MCGVYSGAVLEGGIIDIEINPDFWYGDAPSDLMQPYKKLLIGLHYLLSAKQSC